MRPILLALLLCAGCVNAPTANTGAFVKGVAAVQSASDTLYDDLGVAERNVVLRQLNANPASGRRFDVANAYYYSTIGDPPLTTEFRSAIGIIAQYADLLNTLSNGSNNAAARAQTLEIAENLSSLAGTPEVALAAAALKPVIDQLLLARSVAEARQLALDGAPRFSDLIGALKNSTPAMFKMLVTEVAHSSGINSSKLTDYRTALANYVVLLDRLQKTFGSLVEAFKRPSDVTSIASLSQATGMLQEDVKAVRQALAAARSR
ncbi:MULTISPECIES: hypothetical protein [unclassified Mesorhizobium]|uniref:hypothetical protein n=1 Tax=unclassified Mesorhizobium TaxID=325217 RepID=UPI00112A3B22|nr:MULTISPECIES: hypothetical protein [unclassified Mesorhizobium]TPM03531.1 hypothetical protein FJ939_18445 [Mesorhizobium sp. B2-3-8]TPM12781.1 hypothetical protein FJ940_20000 [Mesorhizobium sp. B2-3-7]